MSLIIQSVQTRQPIGSLTVQSRFGRVSFAMIGTNLDAVTGRRAAVATGDSNGVTSIGKTYRTVRSANGGLSFGTYQPIKTDIWTILVLANPVNTSAAVSTLYSQRPPSGNGVSILANSTGNGSISAGGFGVSCESFNVSSVGAVGIDGRFHLFGARRDGASNYPSINFDGQLVPSTGGGGAPASTINAGQETVIGRLGNLSSSVYSSENDFAFVVIFDGLALPDPQMRAIAANPWQLFKAPSRLLVAH